jgi:hypothetical protein
MTARMLARNMDGPRIPIPQSTPSRRLRRLLARYADPNLAIPTRYRLRMVLRIVALLVVGADRPERWR